MNREQRRRFNKKHHTNYTANDFALMEMYAKVRAGDLDVHDLKDFSPEVREAIHIDNKELVPEGTPVKLNVKDILTRPNKMTQKYLDWVRAHEQDVFHVTREEAQNSLVCLAEDVAECHQNLDKEKMDHVPWLFDIYSDLLYEENGEWKLLEFLEKTDKYFGKDMKNA